MNYITRSEALQEASRLTKMTGREMDARTVDCECDAWPYCYLCAGNGAYQELVYLFCNHPVRDDDHDELECLENFCSEREKAQHALLREEELEAV
jgi:hypothetical protein